MTTSKQHPIHNHLIVHTNSRIYNTRTNKFLTVRCNSNGYYLTQVNGKALRVHRLVAETFLQESECYGLDVNHMDGKKSNNNLSNLEWCTRSHNIKHAIDLGLNPSKGETHPNNKYSEELVKEVCKCLEDGWRNIDIVKHFNLPKDWVAMVRTGKLWTHISKDFKITFNRNERLSPKSVHTICKLLEEGLTIVEVSKTPPTYCERTIGRIKRREIFKDISSGYSFDRLSRVTTSLVQDICSKLQAGETIKSICEELGVTRFVVGKIKNRKTWLNISKAYKF